MTQIQTSIYHIISQSNGHMTAEQVLLLVRQTHPTASLSTVYRNLNLFADAGQIRRIQRATSADYYERNLQPHDHAHCVKCGKMSDLTITGLKDFLRKDFQYPICSFELVINYVCPECAGKQAPKDPTAIKGGML